MKCIAPTEKTVDEDTLLCQPLDKPCFVVDGQAEDMFFRLVEQMKQAQGITEQLKAENTLEWVQRMNNIQACVRKIVEKEIIYI